MEVIKWLFSVLVALTVTLLAMGMAIGAIIFATVLKLVGLFGFIAAAIALIIKESMDKKAPK